MEKPELIKEIVEFHRQIIRSVRLSAPDAWMRLSMTIPQVKSLFFITNHGSTNFKKLATALKVTPSNLTGVIDRLVEQGLVSRTENPEDRRQMTLKATEKGEALVSDLRERTISYLSRSLSGLSQEELSTIARGLEVLAKATKSSEGEPLNEDE
jgi:MarR family transcriptional regulator, organic hydroperoxide resistance regulator